MKWDKKEKKTKEVKIKEQPELGDFKRRVRFAVFPVKVKDKWLWWEKFVKVWMFKRIYHTEEHVVSSGLLEDALTTTMLLNTRTVEETTRHDMWCYHSREFYVA
jgi:hypothetical protein